jgi:hypothetical protein
MLPKINVVRVELVHSVRITVVAEEVVLPQMFKQLLFVYEPRYRNEYVSVWLKGYKGDAIHKIVHC